MAGLNETIGLTCMALMAALLVPAAVEAQADDLGAPPPVEDVVVAPAPAATPEAAAPAAPAAPPSDTTVRVIVAPAPTMSPAPPPAPVEGRSSAASAVVPSGYRDYAALPAPSPAPPATAQTVVAAPIQVAGPNPVPHHEDAPSRLPRIAVMLGAGGATMAGVGFGFYAAGCAMGDSSNCEANGAILAVPAALSLTPLAVYLSGNAMGGNGGYGWSLMGTGVGTGAGLAATTLMFVAGVDDAKLLMPLMIAPVLGSVIAYEASSDPSREWAARRAPRGVTWSASVAPVDRGAMAAVAGTF